MAPFPSSLSFFSHRQFSFDFFISWLASILSGNFSVFKINCFCILKVFFKIFYFFVLNYFFNIFGSF